MFYRVFELVLVFSLALLIVTQVLIPALRGTPNFPMFRREKTLKTELQELQQEEVELALQAEVEAKRAKLHPVAKSEEEVKETITTNE